MPPHDHIGNKRIKYRPRHRRTEPDEDSVPQRAYKARIGEHSMPGFHRPWIGNVEIAEGTHECAHQQHDHGHDGHGNSRQRDHRKYRPAPTSETRRVGAEAASRHRTIVALAEITAL